MKKAGASEAEIKKANDKFEAEKDARSNVNAAAGEDQENIDGNNGETGSQKSQRSTKSQRLGGSKQAEDEDQKPIPEGYFEQVLHNVDQTANKDELLDFAMGEARPKELQEYQPGIKLISKISWQFSFQKREEKTDAYYENLAEQQELERTRQKKELPNILKTLGKLRGDKDLLNKNLGMLSLVLASESCNLTDSADVNSSQVL